MRSDSSGSVWGPFIVIAVLLGAAGLLVNTGFNVVHPKWAFYFLGAFSAYFALAYFEKLQWRVLFTAIATALFSVAYFFEMLFGGVMLHLEIILFIIAALIFTAVIHDLIGGN